MALEPERTDLSRMCLRQLPRATRSSRERQLQSLVAEFCQLSFDLVDPSEQAALTRRMLAFLLYLDIRLPYWESSEARDSGEPSSEGSDGSVRPRRLEEKAYQLLGISDDDMWAIERLSDRAGKHLEANRYRAAYGELCVARLRLTAAQRRARATSQGQPLDDQKHPQNLEHIVQAHSYRVCCKDQAVAPGPEVSCGGDFADASTADELSDRDTEAEQHHVFIFEERAGKLESNDTRLVKRKALPFGDFAFILLPKRLSQKKSCSGFRAARGLCNVQVKKCEGAAADVELRVLLHEGARPIIVRHDFSQSSTCEIDEFVDLRRLVDVDKDTFSLHFSLISGAS